MHTTIVTFLAVAFITAIPIAHAEDGSKSKTSNELIVNAEDRNQSTLAAVDPQLQLEFAPMTRSERLRDYLMCTFGVHSLTNTGVRAEFNQLARDPKEWGNGPKGFAKRAGSSFAQHFIRQTIRYGVSSLLHEDNRYLRSERTGFWRRARYAIASSFLARHDNGHRSLSISGLSSAAGAAFISRAWLPRSIATASAGAGSLGITIGADIGVNMLREFWPDMKRHFRRH